MEEERRYPLPRFSVNRPVTVIMVLAALLVVGAIAYLRIPLALFPEGFDHPRLHVWCQYPNASPIEVEEKIIHKVEEAVAQVSRVKKIRTGSYRGGGWANVEFLQGTDLKGAFAELKDRLERVMPEMPDEVEQLWVRRWDENDIPIIFGALTFTGDFSDHRFLLETYVEPALRRIEGVGNVELWGTEDKQVLIEMDQDKVRGHGVNMFQLVGSLRSQNITLPGGWVKEGGKKIYVRSIGRFQTVEEIRDIIVDPRTRLRLRDIASVELKRPKEDRVDRIGRQRAMGFAIFRASEANLVDISRGVNAAIDELKQYPKLQGMDCEIFFDQGKHVTESVFNLQNSGMWGGLFAASVLFFFLRAARMTLIITLAIPLSLLVTITFLYFYGWSLNIGTMMGLMLSLGLVVDNAIVIVENIYRKRQEGIEPRKASVEGAGEVGLAVTMATLTTVVVFLPLILMSDDQEMSFWMFRIGMPVIVGLIASLLAALVFIPLAALKLSTRKERSEGGVIAWMRQRYVRSLGWVLDHRTDAFIIVLLAMASIQIPMNGMKKTDQQEGRRSRIDLAFDMPTGQTLEQADRFISGVEDTLMNHEKEYNIKTLRTYFRGSWGRVTVIFNEEENTEWYKVAFEDLMNKLGLRQTGHLDYEEIEKDIRERIQLSPGVTMRVNWENPEDEAAVSISLYGEDTYVLMKLAGEVERRLESIPGLLSVYTDMDRGSTELQVRLDREQVQRYGINPQVVSGNIGYAMRGVRLNKFHTDEGREVDIHLQLKEADRQNMQDLRNLTFATQDGREIPLESLASVYVERTLGYVRRDDRQTMLSVTAKAAKDDSKELFALVDQAMQGFEMPRGYRWDKGARFVRLEEQDQSQKFAVIMSVTFVFLLMGVLFESFVLPLSVIVSIPFSFLGVYWTLYLTNTPQDIMSIIGSVILIGVVVNNAIVLIDLTNRLRDEGMGRYEALIEAGQHRFRPILMTSFTTIFGLIPMAVGNSKMVGLSYAPLGRTMMGGLFASMALTLVLVPLFYTFFDDFRELVQRIMMSAFRRKEETGGEMPEAAGGGT